MTRTIATSRCDDDQTNHKTTKHAGGPSSGSTTAWAALPYISPSPYAPLDNRFSTEERYWTWMFSSFGGRLISAGTDWTVRIWDTESGRQIGQPIRHDDQVGRVDVSADGSVAISASLDGTARLLSLTPAAQKGTVLEKGAIALSADGAVFLYVGKPALVGEDIEGAIRIECADGPPLVKNHATSFRSQRSKPLHASRRF